MTFAWVDYLAVARELGQVGLSSPLEARERAAIGRAYYAVFGRALQVFVDLNEFVETGFGSDHLELAKSLRISRDHRRREIAVCLDRLRPARKWADYNISPASGLAISASVAACTQAQRAINLINAVALKP